VIAPGGAIAARAPHPGPSLPAQIERHPALRAAVTKEIAAAQAKGARDIKVAYAPFERAKGKGRMRRQNAGHRTAGPAAPADFPSGCGLTVLFYNLGNPNILESNSLTSCETTAASISMDSYDYESRFWPVNWSEVSSDSAEDNVQSDLSLVWDWDCSGNGVHNYRTETDGTLEINGDSYSAAAYDEIDNLNCG
jgi:hypothetical protein